MSEFYQQAGRTSPVLISWTGASHGIRAQEESPEFDMPGLPDMVDALTNRPNAVAAGGRDTIIDLPLRVSTDAALRLARLRSQQKWKAHARKSPAYARRPSEFPDARVKPVADGAP